VAIEEAETTPPPSSQKGVQRLVQNDPTSGLKFGEQSGSLLERVHKKLEGFKKPENAEAVKRLMFDTKTKSKILKGIRTKKIVRPLAYNLNQKYHGKVIELEGLSNARRLAAMIGYMVGEESPSACTFCRNEGSNFERCVVVPGYFQGSCVNCAFTSGGYLRTCDCRSTEPNRIATKTQDNLSQINKEEIKEFIREVAREVVREVISENVGENRQNVGARAGRSFVEDIVREVLEEDIRKDSAVVEQEDWQAMEDVEDVEDVEEVEESLM
jgi:hypothetical protein